MSLLLLLNVHCIEGDHSPAKIQKNKLVLKA